MDWGTRRQDDLVRQVIYIRQQCAWFARQFHRITSTSVPICRPCCTVHGVSHFNCFFTAKQNNNVLLKTYRCLPNYIPSVLSVFRRPTECNSVSSISFKEYIIILFRRFYFIYYKIVSIYVRAELVKEFITVSLRRGHSEKELSWAGTFCTIQCTVSGRLQFKHRVLCWNFRQFDQETTLVAASDQLLGTKFPDLTENLPRDSPGKDLHSLLDAWTWHFLKRAK